MKPSVTWLLPVKNGMPYLPETLASIAAQTYREGQVLAWDNGSTDGTVEELRRWIPACLPGRVVTERPMGLGASLAAMIETCETEFCARIDADDVNQPERLERQVAFLREHPEVAAVGTWTTRLDASGADLGPLHRFPTQHEDIVHHLLFANALAHPTVLLRRAAVLEVGNYYDLSPVEDYDLWLRMAAARFRLANLNEYLVRYRIHAQSTTQRALAQNRLANALVGRLALHAPALYGLSEEEMQRLSERRSVFAFAALNRLAHHLQQTQPDTSGSRWNSETFLAACRYLVGKSDVLTRLALAARSAKPATEIPRETLRIGRDVAVAVGAGRLLSGVKRPLGKLRRQMRQDRWRAAQEQRQNTIHPTVEFTGLPQGYTRLALGSGCTFERDVTFWFSPDEGAQPELTVEDRVFLGRNSYLGVFQPIHIGANALIGAYAYIISANHRHNRLDIPIRDQGYVGAPIRIEDDAWLGTHVVVLPGVTIGKGAVVAAGSVVTKDIPPYEVWGGVPAKFLKARGETPSLSLPDSEEGDGGSGAA